ncbi:hypothetical protein EON65_40095, partial [archaeon]
MLLISVLVVLTATWMYRERSWYLHDRQSKELKTSLQQSLSTLQNGCRQHPDVFSVCAHESTTDQCVSFWSLSNDTQQSFCSTHCSSNVLNDDSTLSESPTLATNAVFFDRNGFSLLAFLFSLMQYEYHCIYAYMLPRIQTCVHDHIRDQNVFLHIKRVLGSLYPLTSLLVMVCVCFGGTLAWWGFMNRAYFIHTSLKLCIAYILSCICAYITHNVIHLYPYLPSSQDEWQSSLRDLQWWGWLFLRMWGIHDVHSIIFILVYMGSYLYVLWFCRYFFYEGLKGSVYMNDYFLINMLGHTALNVWGILYTLTLLTIPPFLPLLFNTAPTFSNSSHPIPPASSLFVLRVISYSLLRGRSALLCTFIPLSANIILAALRALYYLVMLRSTYYCYFCVFLGGIFVFNAGIYVYILYMCQYLVCKNDMLGGGDGFFCACGVFTMFTPLSSSWSIWVAICMYYGSADISST